MDDIRCAAIWYDDGIERPHQPFNISSGIVVCGHRHHNIFVILAELFPDLDYKRKHVQGFITRENRFVNRKLGGRVAFAAGQTKELKGELCSEDLY
jgi:hypothetical protein